MKPRVRMFEIAIGAARACVFTRLSSFMPRPTNVITCNVITCNVITCNVITCNVITCAAGVDVDLRVHNPLSTHSESAWSQAHKVSLMMRWRLLFLLVEASHQEADPFATSLCISVHAGQRLVRHDSAGPRAHAPRVRFFPVRGCPEADAQHPLRLVRTRTHSTTQPWRYRTTCWLERQ